MLVNNAGTNPAAGPLVEVDHARFVKTVDVNLWAPVVWTREAWSAWMREHGGAVVNAASIGGYVVGRGLGVYHATKPQSTDPGARSVRIRDQNDLLSRQIAADEAAAA